MVAAFLDIMDFRLIRWIEVQHEVGEVVPHHMPNYLRN
jgi:hypothetical protein